MASLPNKSFLVNWNARNYDSATHTIAKESGQLFDQDLVFPNDVSAYTDTYVTLPSNGNCKTTFSFSSTSDNPFNLYSGDSFTLIAKMKGDTNASWCISNRDSGNYWLLGFDDDYFSLSSIYDYTSPHLQYTPQTTGPLTMGVRISNNYGEYISVTDNTTVGAQLNGSWWQNPTRTIYFFGGNWGSEIWYGDFYWLYISKEALTDAEIAQVVAYNENATTFEPSQDSFAFTTAGGTQTFTVEAENSWTAFAPSDFTVSPLSGSAGDTTVTITAPMRLTTKTNTVTFTDSDTNTFDITITQSDQNINQNLTMYRGSTTVKKMYYGTDLVYRKMAHSPSLTVSPTSLSIDPNGGTQTFTVTTDGTFTATTADSWITLSTSGNTVTVTATSTQSNRSGSITVTATNSFMTKTETVAVSQSVVTAATYVTTSYTSRTNTYIDSGIYPTTDTVIKVKYKPISTIGGALVGFTFDDSFSADVDNTPTGSPNDNTDYRYFYYNSLTTGYFDFNSSRINRSLTYDADGYITVEVGNNYITNVNNSLTTTWTTQGSMATTTVPIYINLGSNAWLQSVEIWQGGNKVYDGYAANDGTQYGWYDAVGNTFTTTTYGGYTITGA